jgi:hypothetical protein
MRQNDKKAIALLTVELHIGDMRLNRKNLLLYEKSRFKGYFHI